MKKIVTLFIVCLLVICTLPVFAIDFEQEADKYKKLCSNKITSENKQVCMQYQKYLDEKINKQTAELKKINEELNETRADLKSNLNKAEKYQNQILEAEKNMEALGRSISELDTQIDLINLDINLKEKQISELDLKIKERLAKRQSDLHVNSTIAFIFGGSSYSEMMRRVELLNQINHHDKGQIDEMASLRKQLLEQRSDLEFKLQQVKQEKENSEKLKKSYESAKSEYDKLVKEFRKQESDLMKNADTQKAAIKFSENEKKLVTMSLEQIAEYEKRQQSVGSSSRTDVDSIDVATHNGGWSYPVKHFWVSAGAWYYPGGGVHYGVDLATSVGSAVTSTGPGIVVNAWSGCPTYGHIGSTCGYKNNWGGNQVMTIVSMNGKLYGLFYAHLEKVNVTTGQQISAGTLLGTVGSSGNSSGPHLHHEVIYLGTKSLKEYLDSWNGYLNFTPNGQWMDLSWTCSARGGVPPCRENPQHWYGLEVRGNY